MREQANRAGRAMAFVGAARRYWLGVVPCARGELRHWRSRAGEIRDPALRGLAFHAQCSKRESLEGALAFAAFAPAASRALAIRAITAYQLAFDYLDELSEQPGADPIANGRQLNQALLVALQPSAVHPDYYANQNCHEDSGYLRDLVDTCRTALQSLPSYGAIADSVRCIAARLVTYQSLNHGDAHGSYEAFTRWARAENRRATGLRWWETGAAAGSPLPVFALIASAAKPATGPRDAAAIEGAYFPWVASLSSLLDSLIDRGEDRLDGQRSLIDYYTSTTEVAARMQSLAAQSLGRTRALSDPASHAMILSAMASFYYLASRTSSREARFVTRRIMGTVTGDFALFATFVLCIRGIPGRARLFAMRTSATGPSGARRGLASSSNATPTPDSRGVGRILCPGEELPTGEPGRQRSRA
jgi:tetraprenyl-beta-curcumene synthase